MPELPANASLDQLRRQAGELRRALAAGDAQARARVRAHHPGYAHAADATLAALQLTDLDAQLVLAREYGFSSWPRLQGHVEGPGGGEAEGQLVAAVNEGDADRIRRLLAEHPGLAACLDEPLWSFDAPALVAAVGRGDRALVEVLLDAGADIDRRSDWWAGGFGVLHHDAQLAPLLIERGATVDAHAAAHLDMPGRLLELLDADASLVDTRGPDGMTPLHMAATPEIAGLLLERGATIDLRDLDHGSTSAQYALVPRPDVCRFLVRRGAEPDLLMACQLGDLEMAKAVLARDPQALDTRVGKGALTSGDSDGGHIYIYTLGYTRRPLELAASSGNPALLDYLLAHATPEQRLLLYCEQADGDAARALLAEHPDLVRNLRPEEASLIADAAWRRRTDAVALMLELGFGVDTRGIHDSTPLDRAAIRGYLDAIDLLLRHGASLEARNEFGGTPLRACMWGSVHFRDPEGDYPASVERLLAAGAPVPEQAGGSEAVAEVLRRHGAV